MAWLRQAVAAVAVICLFGVGTTRGESSKTQPASAAPAPGATSKPDPVARASAGEDFKQLMDQLLTTADPAEGVTLLQKFIDDHKGEPQVASAQDQMVTWKNRADKGLARFGPTDWLPKAKVDEINAGVDKLLAQADSDDKLKDALSDLTKAERLNPHRADVPFKRFEKLMKNSPPLEVDAIGALGKVTTIDKNNGFAINDAGVLQARQKQWASAWGLLLNAVVKSPDTDAILDNYDEVQAMAAEAGVSRDLLIKAESDLLGIVGKLHKLGKHAGETRWGNSWVSDADFAKFKKDNEDAARKNSAANAEVQRWTNIKTGLENQRDRLKKTYAAGTDLPQSVTDQINNFEKQIQQATKNMDDAKKKVDTKGSGGHEPSHADKLILFNLDGTQLDSLEGKPADSAGGGKDPKEKPKGGLFGN